MRSVQRVQPSVARRDPSALATGFCELVSPLWPGPLILLVVRAFRHDGTKLALNQERTAACNLPGNTPRRSLRLSVIAAARVISAPESSPVT